MCNKLQGERTGEETRRLPSTYSLQLTLLSLLLTTSARQVFFIDDVAACCSEGYSSEYP